LELCFFFQEEERKKREELEKIMEENQQKIEEAQRKLVREAFGKWGLVLCKCFEEMSECRLLIFCQDVC